MGLPRGRTHDSPRAVCRQRLRPSETTMSPGDGHGRWPAATGKTAASLDQLRGRRASPGLCTSSCQWCNSFLPIRSRGILEDSGLTETKTVSRSSVLRAQILWVDLRGPELPASLHSPVTVRTLPAPTPAAPMAPGSSRVCRMSVGEGTSLGSRHPTLPDRAARSLEALSAPPRPGLVESLGLSAHRASGMLRGAGLGGTCLSKRQATSEVSKE